MVYKIILTLALLVLSSTLGRMGGAGKYGQWYDGILDTNWRDIGCPLVMLATTILWLGWHPENWWAYVLAGVLTFGSLRTYWDWLFGYDCMWFSGLVVGVAGLPMMWVSGDAWFIFPLRIILLGVLWEVFSKFIPQRGLFCWRRDVAEESLRYGSTI